MSSTMDAQVQQIGDGRDLKVQGSASAKLAFHGATPIAQMTVTTAPAATAATNSTPYGFSQAQADAIITWMRAVDAHMKLKGLIASS